MLSQSQRHKYVTNQNSPNPPRRHQPRQSPKFHRPSHRCRQTAFVAKRSPPRTNRCTPVLTSEDQAAYENHHRQFEKEYQPANAIESQLVKELADTSWRLNRIPVLEADILNHAESPAPSPEPPAFDIVDAHRFLASLGLHGARLSRQFQKTLQQLRDLQYERQMREWNELKDAAAILELHKHEGLPWEPSDPGFVFSKDQVERFSQRMMRHNQARHIAWTRFHSPYKASADMTHV